MTKQRQKVLPKYDFDVETDKQINAILTKSNKRHNDLIARIDKINTDLQMLSSYIIIINGSQKNKWSVHRCASILAGQEGIGGWGWILKDLAVLILMHTDAHFGLHIHI